MSEVKYEKGKLLNAQRATSLKSSKLEVGKVLNVVAVVTPDYQKDSPDINLDNLLCEVDGKKIRVPVREFANFKMAEGSKMFDDSENEGDIVFPISFKITAAEDRVSTRDGVEQKIYPIQAYVDGAEQIRTRKFDFDALLKSGLTDQGKEMDPVQDYTISTEF